MLEKVDLSKSLAKKEYKSVFEPLQLELAALQRQARQAGIPVVVVFEGWEAAGKGTCINRLLRRLDPRGFKVHPISSPNEEELLRPFLWRFATKMPGPGRIAIFDRSWYGRVVVERVEKLVPELVWTRSYDEILQFERQHTDAGVVIVKFWLHISKKEQKRRFKKISADPALAWKVGKPERREHRQYARYETAVEEMLERTSPVNAPWTIVEATDGRYARTKVVETLVNAIKRAISEKKPPEERAPAKAPRRGAIQTRSLLDRVDLTKSMEKPEYQKELNPLQDQLRRLVHQMYLKRLGATIVYEGWDAGGKGGNIKRVTEKLDPRGYEVIPIAAPTKEELDHHYLWRFWKHLPKDGHMTIFDRSWYGRVMVERVEGFCGPSEWQRAFQEINEFERMVASHGTVMIKFWLHISKKEQLRRFKEREQMEHKRWKLTDEDWRNRKKWAIYHEAVVEMIHRTSTTYAPWVIIEGDCKLHARVQALRTVVKAIKTSLKGTE